MRRHARTIVIADAKRLIYITYCTSRLALCFFVRAPCCSIAMSVIAMEKYILYDIQSESEEARFEKLKKEKKQK